MPKYIQRRRACCQLKCQIPGHYYYDFLSLKLSLIGIYGALTGLESLTLMLSIIIRHSALYYLKVLGGGARFCIKKVAGKIYLRFLDSGMYVNL